MTVNLKNFERQERELNEKLPSNTTDQSKIAELNILITSMQIEIAKLSDTISFISEQREAVDKIESTFYMM